MSSEITRREALLRGLGTAGVLATGLHHGAMARQPAAATDPPDQSDRAPSLPVAIQRCPSFEPEVFRQALDKALDLIGGIGQLVRNKTVTVKINLTGMSWNDLYGMPAYETYQTHPHTLAALCAAFDDAGARRIVVVENLYWDVPIEKTLVDAGWDLKRINSAGGQKVTYEDTRNKGAFSGYSRFKVPWGGYIFPAFDLNGRFEKTDVLVSLSKLKQHACAGVTMTAKNLFGITPCSLYGNQAPSENPLSHRTAIFHSGKKKVPAGVPAELDHGQPALATVRVPRIVADIYGARPVDLTIVDGVRTIRGGEGHWNRDIGLKEPKLLLAGTNGLCTDAIGTAVMGFDPQAPHGTHPFQGDNHLRLLAARGMGTIDPKKIEVLGVPLEEAVHPFDPPTNPAPL